MRHLCLGLTLLAVVPLWAQSTPRLVDLGHPLSEKDPTWSGNKAFARSETRGDGFAMDSFSSDEHFGTHLDAPVHAGGAWTTDQIPWTATCALRCASTSRRRSPRTTG